MAQRESVEEMSAQPKSEKQPSKSPKEAAKTDELVGLTVVLYLATFVLLLGSGGLGWLLGSPLPTKVILWLMILAGGGFCGNLLFQLANLSKSKSADADKVRQTLVTCAFFAGGLSLSLLVFAAFVYAGNFVWIAILASVAAAIGIFAFIPSQAKTAIGPVLMLLLLSIRTGFWQDMAARLGWMESRNPYFQITDNVETPIHAKITRVTSKSVQGISDAYLPHYVFVRSVDQLGTMTASGVVIANDHHSALILTNHHVVNHYFDINDASTYLPRIAPRVEVQWRETGESQPFEHRWEQAQVVAVHREYDLAVLLAHGDFSEARAIQVLSPERVQLGDEVLALGLPDLGFRARDGKISSESDDAVFEHSCVLDPGFSGGPLIHCDGGQLIGINTFYYGNGGNYAFFVASILPSIQGKPDLPISDWRWLRLGDKAKVARLAKLVEVIE